MEFLNSYLNELLSGWKLNSNLVALLSRSILALFVIALAIFTNFIAKRFILRGVHAIIKRTKTGWDDLLFKRRVFQRMSHLAPAVVIYFCSDLVFPDHPTVALFIKRLSVSYALIIGVISLDAFLSAINDFYKGLKIARERPINSYVQVVKIIIYLIGAILVLGTLMDRSPMVFLSGLGAMTAVLLLVFKDSLLGLVASVQLSAQNMVRIGDWISMPEFGADGDVIEINLNNVKVQNWDKTISTIPTYALVSNSFKNWRGMSESGGRRIKRALYIDVQTICFCTDDMLERFSKLVLIKDYLAGQLKEINEYNASRNAQDKDIPNGRRLTNIGTFRRYILEYLRNHPNINQSLTLLVRQLDPTAEGIAIEIYAFSAKQEWAKYEDVQSDIFDHIFATVPYFGLAVFQKPSGQDLRALGEAFASRG